LVRKLHRSVDATALRLDLVNNLLTGVIVDTRLRVPRTKYSTVESHDEDKRQNLQPTLYHGNLPYSYHRPSYLARAISALRHESHRGILGVTDVNGFP
jgi:hypothetical protein